jgi:hypothetical protein
LESVQHDVANLLEHGFTPPNVEVPPTATETVVTEAAAPDETVSGPAEELATAEPAGGPTSS